MGWKDIKEACQVLGFGDDIPEDLRSIIECAMKIKSAIRPEPFTESDFTFCVLIYRASARRKAKANG